MDESLSFFGFAEKEAQTPQGVDITSSEPPVMFQLDRPLLPDLGSYLGANYHVEFEIDGGTRETGKTVGAVKTTAVLDGEVSDDQYGVRLYSDMDDAIVGFFVLDYIHSDWAGGSEDTLPQGGQCHVSLTVRYDPGQTFVRTSDTRWVEDEHEGIDTVTEFPEIDLSIDYAGRVMGSESTLTCPTEIKQALPIGESVVVLLDADADGPDDSDFDLQRDRNVVCVDSDGSIRWTIDDVAPDTSEPNKHRYLWRHNGRLWTESRSDSGIRYHRIDPVTGTVNETIGRSL